MRFVIISRTASSSPSVEAGFVTAVTVMLFWEAMGVMSSHTLWARLSSLIVLAGCFVESGSRRASVRSCCTRRVALLMPSLRRMRLFSRASSVLARCAS